MKKIKNMTSPPVRRLCRICSRRCDGPHDERAVDPSCLEINDHEVATYLRLLDEMNKLKEVCTPEEFDQFLSQCNGLSFHIGGLRYVDDAGRTVRDTDMWTPEALATAGARVQIVVGCSSHWELQARYDAQVDEDDLAFQRFLPLFPFGRLLPVTGEDFDCFIGTVRATLEDLAVEFGQVVPRRRCGIADL